MKRMLIFLYEIGRDTKFDRRVNNLLEGRNKILKNDILVEEVD